MTVEAIEREELAKWIDGHICKHFTNACLSREDQDLNPCELTGWLCRNPYSWHHCQVRYLIDVKHFIFSPIQNTFTAMER